MIKLYDLNKAPVRGITTVKDYHIQSDLETGDQTLYFSIPANVSEDIMLEMYLRTEKQEYVIKEVNDDNTSGMRDIVAKLNLEDLTGKAWDRFDSTEQPLSSCLALALAGTGWTVGVCEITKKRTVRMTDCNSKEIIEQCLSTYACEVIYDTLEKTVNLYEEIGEDRGAYFSEQINMKQLARQNNSYDFYTMIIPVGKDGLTIESVNKGKAYLENHQYSNKTLVYRWKDERYTVAESLMEDAKRKLEELSKPRKSFGADVIDLAKISEEYDLLDYQLGDTVTILSKTLDTKEKQRIVSLDEYPEEPYRNSCEIANRILSFEEYAKRMEAAANTVNNITNDNGEIDGDTIDNLPSDKVSGLDAKVEELVAASAVIGNLEAEIITVSGKITAVEGEFGTLKANIGQFEEVVTGELEAVNARIDDLDVGDLTAIWAEIEHLKVDNANINHILAGNITADNIQAGAITGEKIQAGAITAGSGIIAEGAIGDAQISSLSANKLRAGTIDTALVTISSQDSTISITGSQILVNDTTDALKPVNRVTLGKYKVDADTWEYGLLVRSADGQTVMIDGEGVHNAGITDGAVDNNKVAEDANIDGKKLDIRSVVTEINEGETKISSTIVQVGDRSLEIYLGEQTQTISSNYTELKTYTDQAKDAAISTAATDAQKKADAALTHAKDYTDKKEEAVQEQFSSITSELSQAQKDILEQARVIDSQGKRIEGNTATIERHSETLTDHSTQIKANENAIKLKVDTQTYTKDQSTINATISNNLSTAKSYAESQAASAKQAAITAAATDAQKKADAALSGAKTYTNAQISTVNTALSKATAAIEVLQDQIVSKVEKTDIEQAMTEVKLYADQSKGENLVLNGDGSLRGTTGWSSDTKISSDAAPDAYGSFDGTTQTIYAKFSNGEVYDLSFYLKNKDGNTQIDYFCIIPYDSDGLQIRFNYVNFVGLTKLLKDLKDGDTIIYCEDLSDWNVDNANKYDYWRQIGFHDYKSKSGYVHPAGTYTRNVYTGMFANGSSINKTAKTITLSKAWAGGTKKAGTYIAQHYDGSTYIYPGFSGKVPPNTWTKYTAIITESTDKRLSQTASIAFRMNGKRAWISNLVFKRQSITVKEVEEKISTAKSEIKQTTDSIKQSVSSLQSTVSTHTTQIAGKADTTTVKALTDRTASLETSVSGITGRVSSVESTVKTHTTELGTVDSRINTAKSGAISSAATDAQKKADAALSNAKNYTNTQITTVNKTITDKVAEINATTDSITSRVSKTEQVATAALQGKMLYTDPTFKSGTNGIKAYNNSGNGTVTVKRVAKSSDCPTTSGYMLEIKTTGAAGPRYGGFSFGTGTRANAIFLTKIIAKIPSGSTIVFVSNNAGTGYKSEWLTGTGGTGKWQEYICKVTCGSSGPFYNTNYFYINGGSVPITWYVAFATVWDATETSNLESRVSAAEIKITDSAITSVVSKTFATKDSVSGKVDKTSIISAINQTAESIKILASKIELTGKVTFSMFDSGAQSKITTAQTTADAAKSVASTAQSTANTAKTTADSAKSTATTAKSTADSVNSTIGAWCYNNNRTYINGGKIYTGSITADKIKVSDLSALKATIGGWTIGAHYLSTKVGSNYSVLKNDGNVAFATASPSASDTTGASCQIWHDGHISLGDTKNSKTRTEIYGDRFNMYNSQGFAFRLVSAGGIEFYGDPTQNPTPYLDWHYNGDTGDYSVRLRCTGYDTLQVEGGSLNTGSDERLKKNIASMSDKYLALFDGLNPITFQYREHTKKTYCGFSAQEVERSATRAGLDISTLAMYAVDDQGYRSLAYQEFTAINTLAIKRNKTEIERLKERMLAAEKRADTAKARLDQVQMLLNSAYALMAEHGIKQNIS